MKHVLTLNNLLTLDTVYKCTVHLKCHWISFKCTQAAEVFFWVVPLMFSLQFQAKLGLTWKLFHFGIILPTLLINPIINRTDHCHLLLGAFTLWEVFLNEWVKNTTLMESQNVLVWRELKDQ